MASIDKSLFDRLGGQQTLQKVHKIFYDKLYIHPWLQHFFNNTPQDILESQQSTFMTQLMGGPKIYAGKTPKNAHQHMFISEEIFDLRHAILSKSIKEAGISDDLRQEWLNADMMLKRSLTKASVSECSRSYKTQELMNYPKPA